MLRKLGVFLILLGALTLVVAFTWGFSYAQGEESHYFPETGHVVSGDFLKFYEQVPNAEFYFGYPISEAFIDDLIGKKVQYFQRARLESHPDEIPELQVQLTPLGTYLERNVQPLPAQTSTSGCRAFELGPDTFHVCYAFLEFFERHGGVSTFGFPVTDFVLEDGRIVQYFNRAKFSWHPELPPGQLVQLEDIGRLYFYQRGENQSHLIPGQGEGIAVLEILELKVHVFTEHALVPQNGRQSLNVIVQNQSLQPVSQAQVTALVRQPDGDEDSFLMPPTDEFGISRLEFTVEAGDLGPIEIEVTASYDEHQEQTRTSFRRWW